MKFDIPEFLRDRHEALLSLSEEKLNAYMRKYGIKIPKNPEVYWRGVHKAITASTDLPLEFRRKSKKWLDERGSSSADDGDL